MAAMRDDVSTPPLPAHCMRQSKITEFFPPRGLQPSARDALSIKERKHRLRPAQPRASFLSLPPAVRDLVYDYADVPSRQFIDLNQWAKDEALWGNIDGSEPEVYEEDVDCISLEPFPSGLLRASRVVRDDVEARLYAENAFGVALWLPEGLRPLEKLGDTALRKLRMLIVRLHPCKCIQPFCCKVPLRRRPIRDYIAMGEDRPPQGHRRRLGCVSRRDKATIAQWRRICARLAANICPSELELYLIANVEDAQVAKAILEPLHALPALKKAVISLRERRDDELRALARTTALLLMSRDDPRHGPQPFRFLSLPLELQLQVLGFTELVSPSHISWSPSETFASAGWAACGAERDGQSDIYHLSQLHVFCHRREAAYHPQCECRSSPLELFVVSRAFGAVARAVFYSRNHFVVLPSLYIPFREVAADADTDAEAEAGLDPRYKFTVESFLTRMPTVGIQSLSHLSLVFPPCTPTYLLPEQKAWGAWLHAVDLLAQHANLPGLTLEIHFADEDVMPIEALRARRLRNTPEEEQAMYDTYERILTPLKSLASLRALLVYVAWPVHSAAGPDRNANATRLERMVMGENYDSWNRGKQETSAWCQPDRFWWAQYY